MMRFESRIIFQTCSINQAINTEASSPFYHLIKLHRSTLGENWNFISGCISRPFAHGVDFDVLSLVSLYDLKTVVKEISEFTDRIIIALHLKNKQLYLVTVTVSVKFICILKYKMYILSLKKNLNIYRFHKVFVTSVREVCFGDIG